MREADDDVLLGASIFVDNLGTAPQESGDILNPVSRGVISFSDIEGDLFGLCRGLVRGRTSEEVITVFKSVGIALEDLAAGTLAFDALTTQRLAS
jgi:ornithine cyclodeaminase